MPAAIEQPAGITPSSILQSVVGSELTDCLLDWPPDVFAMTDVMLERTETYRFALSAPVRGWPPAEMAEWPRVVVDAGREWGTAIEDGGPLPGPVTDAWAVLREFATTPFAEIADAHGRRWCAALLTLHAIADEACAGLGVALDSSYGEGLMYRARGRELLARRHSLARFASHLVRVLPRLRTPPTSTSPRSLSRYASTQTPGVELRWHKTPSRTGGRHITDMGVNHLLLPWPMRVRESDFRPVPGSVQRYGDERFGFFEFAPAERLDLELVDRVLLGALDEVSHVDVVILPESAIDAEEIPALEATLRRRGVVGLVAGVRGPAEGAGELPRNWVHLATSVGDFWVHVRQDKHHRWSLDETQVNQYHLSGALHPHVRWWEAMEIPRHSIQLLDIGEGATVVSLVCEDLAQIDDVADVIRSVGPTIVIAPLLDGPQLSSRWAARYASVLADDPGSAVLTVTSYGMAQRSRPPGRNASPVIALWKGADQSVREIALDPGAQGVLLSASTDRATRRSFDGRRPVVNGNELVNMSVYQVRPVPGPAPGPAGPVPPPALPDYGVESLTVLTSWAEAISDAVTYAPDRLPALRKDALPGAPWRGAFDLPDPSPALAEPLDNLFSLVQTTAATGQPALDLAIVAALEDESDRPEPELMARRVMRSVLQQRHAREAETDE